jgi:hypothetical protein
MVWDYTGPDVEQIPAIQSVLRAEFKVACSGHSPAQRNILKLMMQLAKDEIRAEDRRKASEQAEQKKTEA